MRMASLQLGWAENGFRLPIAGSSDGLMADNRVNVLHCNNQSHSSDAQVSRLGLSRETPASIGDRKGSLSVGFL